jgi:hypothetical protein
MPSMRNCRDSSMSLVKGIETLKCEATGGRWGCRGSILGHRGVSGG